MHESPSGDFSQCQQEEKEEDKAGEKELPCTYHLQGISQSVSKKRKKKIREMPKGTHFANVNVYENL